MNSTKGSYDFTAKAKQYRRYTDAELRFAHRDALEAAETTATFDPIAEGWYRDDAATIWAEYTRRVERRPVRVEALYL